MCSVTDPVTTTGPTLLLLCYVIVQHLLQTHIVLHNKGQRMLESGHEFTRFTRNATLKRHTLSG